MERPQTVYEKLYQKQSLRFEQSPAGLTVEGTLKSGEYELAGNVSSQFISGLLFALPLLAGDSTLHLIPPVESRSYIEMTRAAPAAVRVESRWQDETTLFIPAGRNTGLAITRWRAITARRPSRRCWERCRAA